MNQDEDRARETQIGAMRATMERQRETIKGLEEQVRAQDARIKLLLQEAKETRPKSTKTK